MSEEKKRRKEREGAIGNRNPGTNGAAADARSMSLGDQRPLEEGCLALN